MGQSNPMARWSQLVRNAQEIGWEVEINDHPVSQFRLVRQEGEPLVFSRGKKGEREALQAIREQKRQHPPAPPPLPEMVFCPLCHAVFAPTEELLNASSCPACGQMFDYDDQWETS